MDVPRRDSQTTATRGDAGQVRGHSPTEALAFRARELRYSPEIDGLRGVAVLSVIGYHAFPELFPGGFVGVDVFFVISGYLISAIIIKGLQRNAFTLSDFYARRARRILPALIAVLAACLIGGWFLLLDYEFAGLAKHVAAAGVFVPNLVLWQEDGYFDPEAEFKPLLHLWSLGIEEQFYLLWPLFLLLLWRRPRYLIPLVALAALGSFVLNVILVYWKPVAAFYLPVTRFWELGLGGMLALFAAGRGRSSEAAPRLAAAPRWLDGLLRPRPKAFAPILGILLILASVFLLQSDMPFPGWAALLPTLGAVLIIASGSSHRFSRLALGNTPLVFVGLISYPLYLWHWPLLSFATILEGDTPPAAVRIVAVLIGFGLAWMTFMLIERPIRRRKSPRLSLTLAGGTAAIAATAVFVLNAQGFPSRMEFDTRTVLRQPRTDGNCVDLFADRRFNYCRSTDRGGSPEVLFLGDSHAQAFYDGSVSMLGGDHRLMLLATGGCPPLLNTDVYDVDGDVAERGHCREVWRTFTDFARKTKPPVVVLIGRGAYYYAGETFQIERADLGGGAPKAAFQRGFEELVRTLGAASQVIYVMEQPYFETSPNCFMRPVRLWQTRKCAPVVSRKHIEREMASYRELVRDVQRSAQGLSVVDTFPALCDEQSCYQRRPNGQVLYSDEDHLSSAGGRYVVESSGLMRTLRTAMEATGSPTSVLR